MPELTPLFSVLELAAEAKQTVQDVLEPFGLTEATFGVLCKLRGGTCTNKHLAAETGCAPSNITRLVDRLVENGFAERQPAEEDRRRVVTRLTPHGLAQWTEAASALEAAQDELLARVRRVVADDS